MIPFEILFAVIPFALAATLTPGPNNMIVLAAGLRGGFSGAVTAYAPADAVVTGSLVIALGFLLVSIVSQSVWAGFGTGLRRFLQNPVSRQRCNTGMAIVLVLSVLPTVFG